MMIRDALILRSGNNKIVHALQYDLEEFKKRVYRLTGKSVQSDEIKLKIVMDDLDNGEGLLMSYED